MNTFNHKHVDIESFILLPDQMYKDVSHNTFKDSDKHNDDSDSDSNDDSDMSAEEYLKEMEKILRKIRKGGGKRSRLGMLPGTRIYNIKVLNLLIKKQHLLKSLI